MGVDENGWKRDVYAKHYPDGFEVEYVEVTSAEDIDAHAGLSAALAKADAKAQAKAVQS
jgi:hypothetical protein